MKKLIQVPLLVAAVLALAACSTIGTRIHQNAAYFNSLDPNTRAKIAHGDVEIGFTPRMVYIALGNPDLKRERVTPQGRNEVWIYRSYYEYYDGTAMVGYRRWFVPYGHFYRVYWEPVYRDYYHQETEDNIRVTFRNGRVIMIDQAKR